MLISLAAGSCTAEYCTYVPCCVFFPMLNSEVLCSAVRCDVLWSRVRRQQQTGTSEFGLE